MPTAPYFSRVWLSPYSTGGVAVQWRLNPSCGLSGTSFSFNVYRGVTGGDWEQINESPVVDDTIFVDENLPVHLLNNINDGWYMVAVISGSTEYESEQVPITGQLSAHEWRLIRESMRAHTKLTETYCGIAGWLFRKKTYGTRCTACYDSDLGGTTNSACATCYGTGWVGGYHDALDFTMIPTARGTGRVIRTPSQAAVRDDNIQFLCQAVPQVHSEDVWMNDVTGDHYLVKDIQTAKAFRGVPMAYTCVLEPLSAGDIADKLMPSGYTAPDWTGDVDNSDAATITIPVDDDFEMAYEDWVPIGESDYADFTAVTTVFEVFDSYRSMNNGTAALLTVTDTPTADGSVWTATTSRHIELSVVQGDISDLGVGEHYYKVTFTLGGTDEIIEHGDLIIEAS